MRNSPAYALTSIVIALAAGAVCAQTTGPRIGGPATIGRSVLNTAPRPMANTTTTTTNSSSTAARPTVTQIPAGTASASGTSTTTTGSSTGQTNSITLTNADGSATTTTLNADGTRTIVTMNRDGTTTTTRLPENLFNPALINGAIGGVSVDGERLVAEAAPASQADSLAVEIQERLLLNADVQRSSASLNRVIRQAENDRRKIGRNGQLLHSIAPRTNVDRSGEMPDDAPTPALSGLSNSLIRR